MNVQDKIKKMENKKREESRFGSFRKWLDEYLPEHKSLKRFKLQGQMGKEALVSGFLCFYKVKTIKRVCLLHLI